MLELREYFEHLIFDELNILIQELLNRVGRKIEEHRQLLESGGVGRLIDVDDVGKNFSQIAVNVVVEFPFDLAQKVPVNQELIAVNQQFFTDALHQSF